MIFEKKPNSIKAGNLNSHLSYLITTVSLVEQDKIDYVSTAYLSKKKSIDRPRKHEKTAQICFWYYVPELAKKQSKS